MNLSITNMLSSTVTMGAVGDDDDDDDINIIDGPFKGFEGAVSEIDAIKGKLKVMVSMFGRETPVELDALQVKKI